MINYLKNCLKKHNKLYKLVKLLKFICFSEWKDAIKHDYPKVLQFPITNKCNSKCVMCNVYKLNSQNEMTLEEFQKIINDPLFKKVESIGINGGEPFIFKDLILFIKQLVKSPNVRYINIISNGFLTELILDQTKEIYKICKTHNIQFHISFSLDGYGVIHDRVRGIEGAFEKIITTVDQIANNKELYCDSFDLGCTVVRQNVNYLVELDTFARIKKYPIKYRLGIENDRLNNNNIKENYSILKDVRAKQIAREFFYFKIFSSNNLYEMFKYYSIFSYLAGKEMRLLGCDWKNNGVTLDSKGNIYYCAVKSPAIANLKLESGDASFFSESAIKIKSEIINTNCSTCIHDYFGKPRLSAVFKFLTFIIFERYWIKQFK